MKRFLECCVICLAMSACSRVGAMPLGVRTLLHAHAVARQSAEIAPLPQTWTVSFDANGGELADSDSSRQVEDGTPLGELPVPSRDDYLFIGWFTAADGGEEVSAKVVVTSGITFYAHWQCRFSFDEGSWWTQQTDGSWKSNPTADGVTNSLSMTVSGSGTIAFRWKTSCEGYFNFKGMLIRQDGISLIVDDEERTFTNGIMSAWAECSLAVEGDGNHDLVWAYIKDSSGFEGADCAWLDSVVWTPEGYADPLPEVASDSEVADVLASAVDEARLRAHIFDKVQYDRFRAWVDGNGLDHQVVKDSDRAWFSYAIDANGLVDREFKDGDVTIRSLETSSLVVFTFEVDVKDIQLGAAAMAENLATVFGIQGAVALEESAFSSRNVIVTLGVSSDGRLVVTATPKQASDAFFVRVRMHTDADAADDDGDVEHAMVQLWEGGPYWATTNIGAEKPEDYGYYFWWGDTVGYKWENDEWVATDGSSSNFSFSSSNTPTYAKSIATLNSEGWISADSVLVPAHDAAHVHWGGDWRMPTDAEISSLVANCTTKWITTNGVLGRLVTGKGAYADRSIFLPAAGYGRETSLDWAGSEGAYWFSTPSSDYYDCAWGLDFKTGYFIIGDDIGRPFGFSIRPVQGFTE